MWNDANETWIGGNGQVYVAPVGTALPKDAKTKVASTYSGLGYHTEDGVKINQTIEVSEYGAWQSEDPIRRERKSSLFEVGFSLVQWNDATLPFAKGGGKIESLTENQFKYVPPTDEDALEEKALLVDVEDGQRKMRIFVPRGTVTDQGENLFNRDSMANLQVTFKALKPNDGGPSWYVVFDDSDLAMAAGS